MAKNLASPSEEKESSNELSSDYSDSSYELALNAVDALFFDQEHISQLMQAVGKSRDPSQVVGTALGQITLIAYNKLNQADLGVDDMVWASDEGVLDSAIEEVVEFFAEANIQLDPPAVAAAVAKTLKDSPVAQGQQPAAPQGGAPASMAAPQGAMQ